MRSAYANVAVVGAGHDEVVAALSARCRRPALEVDVAVVPTPVALQMAELAGGSLTAVG